MRVLLDTHIVLGILRRTLSVDHPKLATHLSDPSTQSFVSVASLWEIAIKTRLGKLDPGLPLSDLDGYLRAIDLTPIPIGSDHVVAAVEPEPATRDPFDRLLLAVCQVENLRLVTVDRALIDHRLALKV